MCVLYNAPMLPHHYHRNTSRISISIFFPFFYLPSYFSSVFRERDPSSICAAAVMSLLFHTASFLHSAELAAVRC